jgi:hypothetical protein
VTCRSTPFIVRLISCISSLPLTDAGFDESLIMKMLLKPI